MKVVVAHHLWSRVGGGELVNAYVVKTLLEAGHEVIAVSTFNFEKEKYREWFGVDLEDTKTYSLLPKMLPLFGIYQRLGIFIPLSKAIEKEKPDAVFIDCELYKPVLKLKERVGFRLLEYIHFPFHAFLKLKTNLLRNILDRAWIEYWEYHRKYDKGFWKPYFKLWLKLFNKVARDNPFEVADIVMVNSRYIATLVKKLWGSEPVVLNPPVRVRDFEPYARRPFEKRDNAIVMIGRISPEKRIEDVIDAIALTETKPALRVVGGLIQSAVPYKKSLERMAKKKGVKIEFYPNVSREELVKIATSSKVFVHATVGEHFGIAVVEGIAAGCPVIVHRSGGPYVDITNFGVYGLSYNSIGELAKHIDRLLTDPKFWRHYHEKSLSRAPAFSESEFSRKLLKVIEG